VLLTRTDIALKNDLSTGEDHAAEQSHSLIPTDHDRLCRRIDRQSRALHSAKRLSYVKLSVMKLLEDNRNSY
jgi:hypothetical protein